MNILKEFYQKNKCPYLDDLEQNTHYLYIPNTTHKESQDYIERGYRRFGKMYFRPECKECSECQSIKIDVQNYIFSKSEKRVLKKMKDLEVFIQKPSLSQEHINLFNKYHLHMQEKKDWKYSKTSPSYYYDSFVDGHNDFGFEVLYFYKNTLIGVDLIDIYDDGISSIYFYYDPDFSSMSLGKLSLLYQIKIAMQNNKDWIYLGYYVKNCNSLNYKANYKPYITLKGRPTIEQTYKWS